MKIFRLLSIFLVLSLLSACNNRPDENTLRVISLNIRYDNPQDSINAWPVRAGLVSSFLSVEKPDIFGLQEVLANQMEYLDSVMTRYGSVGVGRSDGVKGGEMNPVFYRKDRFEMIRTKTFWLSETPEVAGSMAWDSGLPRIVTWMELADKNTHKHFFFFNTHFAHDSDSARIMSARMLLDKVDSIAIGFPFIITGDFNMQISSRGYKILTGPHESVPLLSDSYAVSEKRHIGPAYTYNGFSDETRGGRIDYIFVRSRMRVLENRTYFKKVHGVYISDHWPVMALVCLK
jgi:endonuclease/exonuclease/phosphatase family metal-dependent hydrolase